MATVTKALASLTAADLMSRNLTLISRHMSLRAAARLLAQFAVSGAPVIDEMGRCVGVLSTTDLVHWMVWGDGAIRRPAEGSTCVCSDWQMVAVDRVPEDEVAQYMTTNLVTAGPEVRVGQLARWMLDAHIHRVVIVNEQRRPIGIVSSTDILAAVADGDFHAEAEEGF